MKKDELLKRMNDITGRDYKSLDEISHHSLMAIYAVCLIALLEQHGKKVQIFSCRPRDHGGAHG